MEPDPEALKLFTEGYEKIIQGISKLGFDTSDPNFAETAARADTSLPPRYHRYYRWWFRLGWAAFLGVLVIFYLMVAKPV